MMRLLPSRPSYVDRLVHRFVRLIVECREPPDREALEALDLERRRSLYRLMAEVGSYVLAAVLVTAVVPEWGGVALLLVVLAGLPRLFFSGRMLLAAPVMFEPACEVKGLMQAVEQARIAVTEVDRYLRKVEALGRPLLRIEALAIIAVSGPERAEP